MKFRRPAAVRAARRRLRVCATRAPACARVPADRMWPSAAQQNTWPSKRTPFGITRGVPPQQSDGSRRGRRHDAKHQFIPFKWLNCQGAWGAYLTVTRRPSAAAPGQSGPPERRRRAGRWPPGRRVGAVDGNEQAARGLRVIEELHELRVDVRRNARVAAESAARWSVRRPARCPRPAPGRPAAAGPPRLRFRACSGSPRPSPTHGRSGRTP